MVELKEKLKMIGFIPQEGKRDVYIKKYDNNYVITVYYNSQDSTLSKIDYGEIIEKQRYRKIHFKQKETLIVLECVNRLLSKGYKPENIELEKPWGLGLKDGGYLDIWVKDESNNSFLMIDCKTYGKEYNNAINKIYEKNGGQIFTYLHQEPKTTKAICYYTSNIYDINYINELQFKNAIIQNNEEWAGLNQHERFEAWNKLIAYNGIFEDDVPLYNIEAKSIIRKNLDKLDKDSIVKRCD